MSQLDKDTVREWLSAAHVDHYECGHCDGTHISALDSGEGPLECRVMWQPASLLLLTQVELRPSAIVPMAALATGLCAESAELKIHVESMDEEPPSLVISHAIPAFIPLSRKAFTEWVQWYLAETQRIIDDVRQTGLLGQAESAPSGGALH
jgi:hypothetical protein